MSHNAEGKLHELRSKTNRELVSLISNKLDRGLAFARAVASDSDWASTEQFAPNAEKALAEATAWMKLLQGVSPVEKRRLESKLAHLRDALDRSCETRVRAAC
jgi:hypothetical protein